ncbi:MAG: RsmD family RNA methyltransferase [Aquificaceae bacterium]|nr:RsmD family RNA methyltransferase [Aquificaceae bacterium]
MRKASRKQRVRPTSELVKQALFNILGDISGCVFLDLFAGTGHVGRMAEERGAEVIYVEKDGRMCDVIKGKSGGKVVRMDALKFLEGLEALVDVIFADPPYGYESYLRLIELCLRRLKKGGIFVLEHSSKLDFGADDKRIYGDTALSFWRKD